MWRRHIPILGFNGLNKASVVKDLGDTGDVHFLLRTHRVTREIWGLLEIQLMRMSLPGLIVWYSGFRTCVSCLIVYVRVGGALRCHSMGSALHADAFFFSLSSMC